MVTVEQVSLGVCAYFEAEIAAKASGAAKFAAYFVLPTIPGIVGGYIDKFRNSPLASGVINADGLVDLEAAKQRALDAMRHCGNVEVAGYRLGADDVEALTGYIRTAEIGK